MSNSRFAPVFLTAFACALLALPALADSQARIVRLSDVQGSVQIDKNTGMGFENAFLNLPITQGVQLQTRDNGRAEVEFEDGSTMHVAPNTKVEFSTLNLSDSGQRVSVVNLVEGLAYVNWLGSKSDQFTLNFSHEKVELRTAAHFRVETSPSQSKFAVFKGDVEVNAPAGNVVVKSKKMAVFDSDDKYEAAKIDDAPLDAWDKEASEYHLQYAKSNSSPYGYGISDLNYYGNYINVPGYGMMWQPFFTGVGWDPFLDGAWAWYPGMGYTFVSAYPWGWLPYRYGNWLFVPGFGWMWEPGFWDSFVVIPRFRGALPPHFRTPVAPAGTVHTVTVSRGGPVVAQSPFRLTVNRGSAGLGIARGSMKNLNRLNTEVARSGSVQVRSTPQFAAASSGRSAGGFSAPHAGGSMGSPNAGHVSAPSGHVSGGVHR